MANFFRLKYEKTKVSFSKVKEDNYRIYLAREECTGS